MEPFQRQFGEWNEATGMYRISPSWLSLFNSLNYIGYAAGVIIGSLCAERFGRRWCMFVMSAWALVPAALAVSSATREQIMVARVLNCKTEPNLWRFPDNGADRHLDIYIGMELAVVPVYQSEIMPSEIRGFAVGSYQFSLLVSIYRF